MKAINLLYSYKNMRVLQGSDKRDCILTEIDEAIAELEAMKPKSCFTCKHWIASWEDEKILNNKNLQAQIKTHISNLKSSGVGKCKDRSLENINKEKHKSYCCNRYEPKEQL